LHDISNKIIIIITITIIMMIMIMIINVKMRSTLSLFQSNNQLKLFSF